MSRSRAKELSLEHMARAEPLGWFEALYQEAEGDSSKVPWADLKPNPRLVAHAAKHQLEGQGRQALVVGCGLGDDAEFLSSLGFDVTAFDVSASAIAWAQKRFPSSRVSYRVSTLEQTAQAYPDGFAWVFEAYTVQSMPVSMRADAMRSLASLVEEDGELCLIARTRDDESEPPGPPWPLSAMEIALLEQALLVIEKDHYVEPGDPTPRVFARFLRGE